jgi:catalase (peroxidase I)
VLEPDADGFRNYLGQGHDVSAEYLLLERAQMVTLSAPEMTVLVGGMRVLNANTRQSSAGVFTKRPETSTNDFFVNLLALDTDWGPTSDAGETFEIRARGTGEVRWTASRVDLVFGSNSELRALAEVYAGDPRTGEIRARLRGRLGQGDESRSIRPCLIPTLRSAAPTDLSGPGPNNAPVVSRCRCTIRP